MSHPKTDRALRRIVADMAALHVDDVAAILDGFSVEERRKVEGLLRDYGDYVGSVPKKPDNDGIVFDASKLSPWLVQRLQDTNQLDCHMTAQSCQTLRDCVVRLFPASSAPALAIAKVRPGPFRKIATILSPARLPS